MDFSAIIAISVPALLAGGAVASWWAAAAPRFSLTLLFSSLIAGQLLRMPLPGQGGGLLLSDIAVVLVLISASLKYFLHGGRYKFSSAGWRIKSQFSNKFPLRVTGYGLLITLFLLWSLFSLALHASKLDVSGMAVALSYWLRLEAYVLLLPALAVLVQETKMYRFTRRAFVITVILLAVTGLAQLVFVPNIERAGWDPHMGRLVSTWFDPNFIGGFFVLAAIWLGFELVGKDTTRQWRLGYAFALVLCSVALIGTRSRSSFLALGLTMLICSPVLLLHTFSFAYNKTAAAVKAGTIGLLIVSLSFLGIWMLGQRFSAAFIDDPTVALRASSLQAVWQRLGTKTALIGVGYNAYQFAAQEAGLLSSFTLHSRAGADSSILTLWVTTGVLGVALFLLPWIYGALISWQHAWQKKDMRYFAAPIALVALVIHAQFINSLLYGHLLIVLATIFALSTHKAASVTQ